MAKIAVAQEASEAQLIAARVAHLQSAFPAEHPRILLTPKDLPPLRAFVQRLRSRSDQPQALRDIIPKLPSRAALPAEPAMLSGAGAARSEAWRQAYTLASNAGTTALRHAFAFLATDEIQHGREAARWLVHLAKWEVSQERFRNNDEQFIQATRPMLIAYDWAHAAMTDEERSLVQSALVARLAILERQVRGKFSLVRAVPPDNSLSHPMRFVSTLGLGAMALLHESPEGAVQLAWTYEYYRKQFPVWGGDDGGWSEGLNYWASGITQHLRFLEAMQLLSFDEPLARPFFRQNAYFAAYNLMPHEFSSFGDLANVMKPSANQALILNKYGRLFSDGRLLRLGQGLAEQYPHTYGYYEYNALDSVLHLFRTERDIKPVADLTGLAQSRAFFDVGWVAMHSKLGDKNDNIMMGFKSSPFGSASHSFADQNSFVINAYGEPLAISSGYREWYGSPHHVGWSRTTQSKNAILVNGRGQTTLDANAKGRITRFAQGERFTLATGDAREAYGGQLQQALRHVLFINRRYFVVVDELQAPQAAAFQWQMHALDKMAIDVRTGTLTVRRADANLAVHMLVPSPDQLRFAQTDEFAVPVDAAFAKRMPNEWHASIETLSAASQQEFVSVLYPYRASDANAVPSIQALPAKRGFALRAGGDVVLLARQAEGSAQTQEAALVGAAAFFNEDSAVLIEGTHLSYNGKRINATAAVSLELWQSAASSRLSVQTRAPVQLQLSLTARPRAVSGENLKRWHYDEVQGLLSIEIAAAGVLTIE